MGRPEAICTGLAIALTASSIALGACGDDERSSEREGANNTPGDTVSFKPSRSWSLPERVIPKPRTFKTPEECGDFWRDKDGKRQPLVSEDPVIVRVDGRCNTPQTSETVGIYPQPEQIGEAAVDVKNGDALGVECFTFGEPIQDERGPRSSSDVWLGVVVSNNQIGFAPETNVGYIDETAHVRQC